MDTELKQLQKLLKDKGYYKGRIDGTNGPATKRAILAMKKEMVSNGYNLNIDTTVDNSFLTELSKYTSGISQSWGILNPDGDNKYSSWYSDFLNMNSDNTNQAKTNTTEGASVAQNKKQGVASTAELKNLQRTLKALGLYEGAVDGIVGPGTRMGVIKAKKKLAELGISIRQDSTINQELLNNINRLNPSTGSTSDTEMTVDEMFNMFTHGLSRDALDDKLREIYTSGSDGEIAVRGDTGKLGRVAAQALNVGIPFLKNQVFGFDTMGRLSEGDMKEIWAVLMAHRPSDAEIKRQLKENGKVVWSTDKKTHSTGDKKDRESSYDYVVHTLFPDGFDSKGRDVSTQAGWAVLGNVGNIEWSPETGLRIRDVYDFNDSKRDANGNIIKMGPRDAQAQKLKNITGYEIGNDSFLSNILKPGALSAAKEALDSGKMGFKEIGEAFADPSKHTNVDWTLTNEEIGNWVNGKPRPVPTEYNAAEALGDRWNYQHPLLGPKY